MHMIVTFMFHETGFVIIFKDLGVGRIDDMGTIGSQNTLSLELMGGFRKGGRELMKKVFKGILR